MFHLVQISNGTERRVALVEEPQLRCLEGVDFSVRISQRLSTVRPTSF